MYTLDQLRCFVAVAEEGGFGRAALRLSMTQPPLSRQVQRLEQAVGAPLLRRTPRGAEPTAAGSALLADARRILALVEAAPTAARRAAAGLVGRVVLGYTAMAAMTVLADWVTAARAELPGVELELREMPTSEQVPALLAGELDLGLVRGRPRRDRLTGRLVHRESLLLAAPVGHPLLEPGKPVRLADVVQHPMVGYGADTAGYFHDLVAGVLREVGAPEVVQRAGQQTSILALVGAGLGVALVPATAARLAGPEVRCVPLADAPADCVELRSVRLRDDADPAVDALLRVLDAN
ncbi:DNA-binding transcriptional LysR family regulator [Kribbella amoyensis]|uniref:DNA-binding transcriptional LysR family regulator n=1 Tax=Kribbella amoyensis TaxID=996641 RepID=A0A561B717_9ACTN|nr:LysR family transcriptional regulator [Kribbella amoyensis]TWD74731.1 DNA-binding transcriptional LysR family regulator [Kribbella amoyensis]